MKIADRAIFSGGRLAMTAVSNKVIRVLDEPLSGDSKAFDSVAKRGEPVTVG